MWQKCPICDGTGRTYNTVSSSSFEVCSVCNGTKIISELYGLPPNYELKVEERQKADIPRNIPGPLTTYPSTDFRDNNEDYFNK